jgi:prephenate dehydrogenase
MFNKAAIIGAGLIGGSIGMGLRQRRLADHVAAVARSEETLRLALDLGAADSVTRSPLEAARGADLVVLATPVSLIIRHLGMIGEDISVTCLVTDVGSVKAPIVAAAEKTLPHPGRFVGGHPLAGSESRGIGSARADLFEGGTWVLTPGAGTEAGALNQAQELTAALGAKPLLLAPQDHDELVARTSHLPHVVAAALMTVIGARAAERAAILDVIGQGFRDTTRIAAGDAALWTDIALANADALLAALDEMKAALRPFAAALAARDREELERLLLDAQRARETL